MCIHVHVLLSIKDCRVHKISFVKSGYFEWYLQYQNMFQIYPCIFVQP
jgi:hypothetical protein